MTNQLTALLLAFIAALCIDIGLVLLKVRGDKVADRAGGCLRSLLGWYASDPLWLLGLFFQPLKRHNGIDQSHLKGLIGAVLAAKKPYLTGALLPDNAGHIARAVTAVE